MCRAGHGKPCPYNLLFRLFPRKGFHLIARLLNRLHRVIRHKGAFRQRQKFGARGREIA